jgi:DNA-directed RNA polymerase specialized sigma subunit
MQQVPGEREQIDGGQSESVFLSRVNWLSDDDPLDDVLLGYAAQVNRDKTPTNSKQIDLVQAVKQDHPYSRHNITEVNKGLLAALVYPFRTYTSDNANELMDTASFGLIDAATQFTARTVPHSFVNFAAPIIQLALSEDRPEAAQRGLLRSGEAPAHTIIRFTSTLKKARTAVEKTQKIEQDQSLVNQEIGEILRNNADILQYIHLPDKVRREQYGVNDTAFFTRISQIRDRVGAINRQSLALLCIEAGVQLIDVLLLPDISQISAVEQRVGPLLHLPFVQVQEIAGIGKSALHGVSTRLREKVNARSRTELVVMTKLADVKPVHEALSLFTQFERLVLPHINFSTEEIMEKVGLSEAAVNRAVFKAAERVGVHGRKGLAYYLYTRGIVFDVAEPPRPLHELFNSKQMAIMQNLHLTNKEIAELDGSNVKHIDRTVFVLQKRAGAKNRIDLMLMSYMFDTGERREPDERTKRERLMASLGWGTLDVEQLQRTMDKLDENKRTLIEAYYLSGEEVQWKTIAQEQGLNIHVAIARARHGIAQMRRMSESLNDEDTTTVQ